jgi:hypothetical protein
MHVFYSSDARMSLCACNNNNLNQIIVESKKHNELNLPEAISSYINLGGATLNNYGFRH